jgi:hypothetical protein
VINKNIFGRSMGFGDLTIRTYTGETTLKQVRCVEEVQAFLEYLIELDKISEQNEERKSFKKVLTESTNADKKIFDLENSLRLNANLPGSNTPTIIYHTHWIILLRKILFPSLLIISLILILLFFTANNIPLTNNPFASLLLRMALVASTLWWLYQFFDWRNDQYHISQDQIIDIYRKPFGEEDRKTASLMNIQSIRFERKGILGLLLDFGTVYIRVGDDEFTFDQVPNPADIQNKLFGALEMALVRKKKSELTEQQQRLAGWMDTYHQIKDITKEKTSGNNN